MKNNEVNTSIYQKQQSLQEKKKGNKVFVLVFTAAAFLSTSLIQARLLKPLPRDSDRVVNKHFLSN